MPVRALARLTRAFRALRDWHDDGSIAYPYSSRELVKLVQHLDRYPTGVAPRYLEHRCC